MQTTSKLYTGGGFRLARPKISSLKPYTNWKSRRIGVFAVLAVLIMTAVAFVPLFDQADSASSSGGYWTYTVTSDGKVTGSGSATASPEAAGASGTTGKYTSNYGTHVGSWGFDSDGYGPFGSFYAAFDACHGNKILCHLDPNDLTQSIDEVSLSTGYNGHTINIMWVLPTVYWSVNSSGNLVLSNDPSKGTAYAHTIETTENGTTTSKTHEYLAIGVYEASTASVGDKTVLTSTTGTKPLNNQTRATFRDYANNNTVATEDGTTVTGHAMLWNLYAWQLYRFCVLTVGGGWNSQGIFGNGDVYGGHYGPWGVNATGDLDKSGPYAGNVGGSDGNATETSGDLNKGKGRSAHHSDSVKAFIEDAWGSLYDFVDGVLIYYNNRQVQMYATQAAVPKDKYTESDYPNKIGVLPLKSMYGSPDATSSTNAAFWGLPSSSAKGSASTGLCDYIFSNPRPSSSSSSPYGLYVGGYSDFNASTAPWYGLSCVIASNDVGGPSWSAGGRLAFVFDADPASITVPKVTYNHDDLRALLKEFGYRETLADELEKEATGKENYDQLKDVAEFRHVGWIVDGTQCAAESKFLKTEDHEARSVWVGLPAVTYDHSELIGLTGDPYSSVGLNNGLGVKGHYNYEQLPSRDGYAHIGWRIVFEGKEYEVGPTDGFVTRNSHTAVSLWISDPTVTFDHTYLTDIVGTDAKGVSNLRTSMTIEGNSNYPQLPNTAGYRHVGWEIDGKTVGPTAGLVSEKTHDAKSLWEKISVIPIIPDGTDPEDPGAVVPIVIEEEHGFWLQKNGKSLLIIAVIAVIIAELAVLSISRKR